MDEVEALTFYLENTIEVEETAEFLHSEKMLSGFYLKLIKGFRYDIQKGLDRYHFITHGNIIDKLFCYAISFIVWLKLFLTQWLLDYAFYKVNSTFEYYEESSLDAREYLESLLELDADQDG